MNWIPRKKNDFLEKGFSVAEIVSVMGCKHLDYLSGRGTDTCCLNCK